VYVLLNGQRRHLEVKKNEEEKVRERKREREGVEVLQKKNMTRNDDDIS